MNLEGRTVAYLNRLRATYTNRSDIHKAATKELNRQKAKRQRKLKGLQETVKRTYKSTFRRKFGFSLEEIATLLGVCKDTVYKIEAKGILKHRIRLAKLRNPVDKHQK